MKAYHLGFVSLVLFAASACGSSVNGNPPPPDGGQPDSGGGDGATSGVLGFTPSNFDPGTLDLTNLPDIDVTQGCSPISSDGGGFNCGQGAAKYLLITQANQIKVGIHVAHSWRIEPNAILNVNGPYPIILVATDKIEIFGSLGATATSHFATAGGYGNGGEPSNSPGKGPGGGGPGNAMGAGGGGSYCGIGGSGAGPGGAGGVASGTPEIVPLTAGSAGGVGSGDGGAGGGAIQLVAANSVTVGAGAYVTVGGGGDGSIIWGSGGGSGGSILIESQVITIAGVLAANGGGGGAGGYDGQTGGDAFPNAMPAPGGTNSVQLSSGGNGSAGATANGADGKSASTPSAGAGGGGGGAGRIRLNTKSGSATLTGGTLSPDATTSCVTQGTLH